jgi:hypothetical protein
VAWLYHLYHEPHDRFWRIKLATIVLVLGGIHIFAQLIRRLKQRFLKLLCFGELFFAIALFN